MKKLKSFRPLRAQRGVILWITLVVLFVMMVLGVGLIRSTETSVTTAGNLMFRQSAVSSADPGVQTARAWVMAKIAGGADALGCGTLDTNCVAAGYSASFVAPAAGQTWEDFWTANVASTRDLGVDAAGNRVRIWIQRMCSATGAWNAPTNDCITQVDSTPLTTSSKNAGRVGLLGFTRMHYSVLVRVEGPKNTRSMIQTILQSDV